MDSEIKIESSYIDPHLFIGIEEKISEAPATEEAPVEAAKENKTEAASPQEDSKAKEELKEEIPAEKKAEEAETKN